MSLGPAPSYLISGDVLCVGPAWTVAAVYRNHAWEVRGRRFVRLDFIGQGLLLSNFGCVPDASVERFGPFDEVLLADGTLFADDRPFSKFVEETVAWYIYETKTRLMNILIEADRLPADAGFSIEQDMPSTAIGLHGRELGTARRTPQRIARPPTPVAVPVRSGR